MKEFEQIVHAEGGSSEFFEERSLALELEQIEVTPENLFEDNQSEYAKDLRVEWRENRVRGNLVVIDKCSDARSFETSPENSVVIPSIAASGPIESFSRVYNDNRSRLIVEMSHFYIPSFELGKNPEGCGGRSAKAMHIQNGEDPEREGDIDKFVRENVPHSDVVINSLFRASLIAQTTNEKLVAAVAQDHSSGAYYVIGFVEKLPSGASRTVSAVPSHMLFENTYNPEQIYKEGLPYIQRQEMPEELQELMEANDKKVQQLFLEFPDYAKTQGIQNPSTLIMSTSTKPIRTRFPNTFGLPGSFFEIRFGRKKIDDNELVDPKSLSAALNQAHYPIAHSTENHENKTKDFSRLGNILIDTGDIDLSLNLACELSEKPWMREWMKYPEHKIIVSQSRGGEMTKAQYLT